MAFKKKQDEESVEIVIKPLRKASLKLRIIGTAPMYHNAKSAQAQHNLLLGGGKKTAAEKVEIKHNPPEEYRNSIWKMAAGPTAVGIRCDALKKSMEKAATHTKGVFSTQVQCLVFVPGQYVPLYGTPQLKMDDVRMADQKRTPDIRTRAYFPRWCAEVEIQYFVPQFSANSVLNLLINAGAIVGVGDRRQEKGQGHGVWRVIGDGDKDEEWNDLVKNHGRMVQLAALAKPTYADEETARLMSYYDKEVKRRAA